MGDSFVVWCRCDRAPEISPGRDRIFASVLPLLSRISARVYANAANPTVFPPGSLT